MDIKYPTVGFRYIPGQEAVSGWGFSFKCGVCGYDMNIGPHEVRHSGFGEDCLQYRTVFEPEISNQGVFQFRLKILEPEWIETTVTPTLLPG